MSSRYSGVVMARQCRCGPPLSLRQIILQQNRPERPNSAVALKRCNRDIGPVLFSGPRLRDAYPRVRISMAVAGMIALPWDDVRLRTSSLLRDGRFGCPLEVAILKPQPMKDDGQFSRDGNDSVHHARAFGDAQPPGLER